MASSINGHAARVGRALVVQLVSGIVGGIVGASTVYKTLNLYRTHVTENNEKKREDEDKPKPQPGLLGRVGIVVVTVISFFLSASGASYLASLKPPKFRS